MALLTAALSAPLAAAPADLDRSIAYRHLLRNSAGIKTLVADIDVETHMKSFPPVSLHFHGHTYFRAPDHDAVVFDNVPGPLKRMMADSPSIAPVRIWPDVYDITVLEDDGTETTFHLVPKDPTASLDHVDVVVGDETGLVREYRFANKNGATTTTDNVYTRIGSHEFVSSQTGTAGGHGYHADIETHFSNYEINVDVPDDVFTPAP